MAIHVIGRAANALILGSRHEDRRKPPLNVVEDCAHTGAAPRRRPEKLWAIRYAGTGTSFAIAHMNAMSSRAIAVTATFGCLPRAVRRRKRLHSRTWAFQPIS